jgi:WD40 repeat protein
LASFNVAEEAYICDFDFFPGHEFKFLACGVNYIAEWAFKGGLLNCQKYKIKKNSESADFNNQTSSKKNVITFYSIIFLKDVAITGGSDGYLYMWGDRTLIKKQNANPKSAILTLFASKNSKIFASGGVDGKAIIWQLGSSSIIQKVF